MKLRKRFSTVAIGTVTVTVTLLMLTVINAQTNPPIDDSERIDRIEFYSNDSLVETQLLGVSTVDSSIHYLKMDGLGNILEDRPATSDEITSYIMGSKTEEIQDATAALKLPINGDSIRNWVSNREAELIQCEVNMSIAPTDFASRSDSVQNQIINGIIDCVELNSKVQWKVNNRLLKLFIKLGVID